MGEYADLILDGDACEQCGIPLDGDDFAQLCPGSALADRQEGIPVSRKHKKAKKTIPCGVNGCGKMFSSEYAKRQHCLMKHNTAKGEG